jgi:TolB-like protein/Tfp pilus assembly protein PilF
LQENLIFDERLEKSYQPDRKTATEVLPAATGETGVQTTAGHRSFVEQIKNHKRALLISFSIFTLAAAAWVYWFFGPQNTKPIESIAVLPFVNESGNPETEYLSDGMTEMLISSLSQLPRLSVKARSSVFRYKGKEIDPKKIAQELSVQAVLLGYVIQRGEQLVLNLELVNAKNENVIWSEQYVHKQTDLVLLQTEIVRDVSNKLQTRLLGAEQQKLSKNYSENSEAYRLYLQGRYYWYKFPAKGYEKSRDYYQQAIDVDPNYALAYAGLSEYYGFGAANGFLPPDNSNWSKATTAANRALLLDETLPDGYNALAGCKQFNNDRAGAERDLKRANELNPNYAEGYTHYAHLLMEEGRSEEAIVKMKKALALEPFNVLFNRRLGWIFYRAHEYDRAIEQYQRTLELDPNDPSTHEYLGTAYEQNGMQKEAVAEWSRALTLSGDKEWAILLERTFAAAGFNAAVQALWRKKLERFNEKVKQSEYVPAMNYVLTFTRLADKEQAFAWLAKAKAERNTLIYDVKLDPIYNSLSGDPRFQDFLKHLDKIKS